MTTIFKRGARLFQSLQPPQTIKHSHFNINVAFHYSFKFSSPADQDRKDTNTDQDTQSSEEEDLTQTESEDEVEDTDTIDAKEEEHSEPEEEISDTDSKDQLSESEKFLIQYRKSQGLHYTPSPDSDFIYKPIPRMPGPSPFINHDYKKESIKKYWSIETLKLPISLSNPLEGIPEIWVHNSNASKKTIYKLSADIFNQDVRIDLLWKCVRFERTKRKHWTWHVIRHRGEVHGTGKKLRKQKGTGKARMSDGKAPQCKGGGMAHGRRPQSVETQMQMIAYKKGLKVALTARYKEGDLYVWEDFVLPKLDKPMFLRDLEVYKSESINKHMELGDSLIPIAELDADENTKLYYDVHKRRQMLSKWGWLKPQIYERVNDKKAYDKIVSAKRYGNIVDILESMPIADFEWDFLKEEDELKECIIPTVLFVHSGYVNKEFETAMSKVNGVELMCWEDLIGEISDEGKRHMPKMGVFKLLKYKKVVFSVEALKCLEQRIGREAEVETWNYYAQLNRVRQDEEMKDAFPNHQKPVNVSLNSL